MGLACAHARPRAWGGMGNGQITGATGHGALKSLTEKHLYQNTYIGHHWTRNISRFISWV